MFGLLRIVSTIQCILRVTSISGVFPRVGSQYRTTFPTKTFKRKCQGAVRWHQKPQNRFHQNGKGQIAHSAFITVIGKIKLIHSITIFIFFIKSFWCIFLTKMILWKIYINFMSILYFSCNSNNYYIFVTARNNRKRREVLKENGTKIPRSYPVWISQCLRATKQRSYYLQGRIAWPLRKFQCTVLQSSSQTKKKQEKNVRHPKKEMTKRKQRKCWGFSETPK